MALNRRNGQRFEANIWPGFVDAMTALLLVLVFVLSIFMIVQFMLRETISVQDDELDNLNVEVAALVDALGLERTRAEDLTQQAQNLNAAIDERDAEAARQAALIASLQSQGDQQAARISSFEEQVAGLLAQRDDLRGNVLALSGEKTDLENQVATLTEGKEDAEARVNGLTARLADIEAGLAREISQKEAAQLALAQARDEIDTSAEQARLAAARREALEALIANLEAENVEKDAELAARATELSEAETRRLADAAAAQALRERLANSDAELTALTLTLEKQRQEAEDTLTLLAAAKAAEEGLNDRIIKLLASSEAQSQRTSQVSDQLAAEEAARLDAEQKSAELLAALQKAQGDNITIADLQEALAARAEELVRAQAELVSTKSDADVAAQKLLDQLRQLQSESDVTAANLREELAAALAAQNAASQAQGEALSEAEQRQALLNAAQSELADTQEVSTERARQIEALNQQVAELRSRLGGLQELLDASAARDEDSNVQIQALGSKLNVALAQVAAEQKRVAEEQRRAAEEAQKRADLEEAERLRLEAEAQELASYRSEFFGQLRELLDDQQGIRIEGDRFVFSSEVLFTPGSANLSPLGEGEIEKVAAILRRIARDIPSELNWVIRVDGHTDNVPLSGLGEFRDNWELSQARALSVVRLLSDRFGIAPNRLAANGFGEYQPIALGDTPEALAQNRRIELKLTEK